MATRQLEGFLFDLDELGTEVVPWVYDDRRRLHRLTHDFHPPVYLEGDRRVLDRFAAELTRRGVIETCRWTRRTEFWSGEQRTVLALPIADSSSLPGLRRLAAARDDQITAYNIDLNIPQYYLYTHGLFPLCRLEARVDEENRVREVRATDDPYDIRGEVPRLRRMYMWGRHTQPLDSRSRIILECDGEDIEINLDAPLRALRDFNFFVARHDPDLILSKRGDGLLFPALFRLAERHRCRLVADRDELVAKRTVITEGRTFYSYGKVLYKGAAYPLRGRWHLDARNSFFYNETGLDGIVEMAQLAKMPVQRMARQSMGTAMTSIQLDLAVCDGTLIPWHKTEPERYKTALELLTIDKGGLTFMPRLGAFEGVAEIDFSSMYPTIMDQHNISPETVLCPCCRGRDVPEAGYTICRKRRGLVARAVAPLVARRKEYKRLMEECGDERLRAMYDNRRTAIKWALVSCFGYLGYKNARFGRIEAHEAVTAYGREKLLRAKEVAEGRGFRVLHALTDSLWIQKAGVDRGELERLCAEVGREVGVEMSLEGVYRWIVFLPSKQKEGRPVATRYYGLFMDGKMKVRGLACRRRDTPLFIKEAQIEILRILAKAPDLAARQRLQGEVEAAVARRRAELESGAVETRKLAIKRSVTRAVGDYRVETRTAQAVRELRDAGVPVHPGETIKYVFYSRTPGGKKRVKAYPLTATISYDAQAYVELLNEAMAELV